MSAGEVPTTLSVKVSVRLAMMGCNSSSVIVTSRRMSAAHSGVILSKSSWRGVMRSPPMSRAPGLTISLSSSLFAAGGLSSPSVEVGRGLP